MSGRRWLRPHNIFQHRIQVSQNIGITVKPLSSLFDGTFDLSSSCNPTYNHVADCVENTVSDKEKGLFLETYFDVTYNLQEKQGIIRYTNGLFGGTFPYRSQDSGFLMTLGKCCELVEAIFYLILSPLPHHIVDNNVSFSLQQYL